MTQQELAEKLNGKKSLVSNYENGYSTPDIFTLCKLADIFDVSLDELVEWSKEKFAPCAFFKRGAQRLFLFG